MRCVTDDQRPGGPMMKGNNEIADEQARAWNGASGRAWVHNQQLLDEVFRPFEALLVEPLSASQTRILDVGCGTGATTLAAARRLGADGQAIGIDISEPMIATARERARREGSTARFICATAQEHAFDPATVDAIISRFGVMFFDDPVKAFANLRRASANGATLRCIVWRGADDNPFMTAAERAAAPLLPELPARRPDGPGQFAFANADRVLTILRDSGWTDSEIQPLDVPCTLPEPALLSYVTQLGPVGRILQEADEATRTRVIEVVRPAFEPYVHGADVRFTAACWMVTARA
jgi:SAM-dependent methyltransferase